MKYLMIAALAFFSAQAGAAEISRTVEARLIEAALDECSIALDAEFTLQSVVVTEKEVDQGSVDTYYDAVFTVQFLGKDEFTVVTKQVRVKAAEYAISNPAVQNFEILSVTSPDKRLCD